MKTVHRVHEGAAGDEQTNYRADAWNDAVILFVFSKWTGSSSQLRSLFTWLQYRFRSNVHAAVLLTGVAPEDMIFPELGSTTPVSIDNITEWVDALAGQIR